MFRIMHIHSTKNLHNTLIGCIMYCEVKSMNIRNLRRKLGDTQSEFAARYGIPFRTIQNWEAGVRTPPAYILDLLEHRVQEDLVNRKTTKLPITDPSKKDLPKRRDYVGAAAWLRAVQACLGKDVVFALDEALMCQGSFGGRGDEYVVWVYGDDEIADYNGVAILGNHISPYSIVEKNGLRFTDFNRTLSDAMANESILDMQGITEAVNKYYYTHGESFNGISVAPEYQDRFEALAKEALDYYND